MPADPRPDHSLPLDTDLLAILKTLSPRKRRAFVRTLTETYGEIWDREWPFWAHPGQRPPVLCPDGTDWATWVLMAGRGFGKTLAGAHWLTERIATGEPLSIALVGASLEDARRVMVEGRSGLLTVAEHWVDEWLPSLRRLRFTTGAVATIFSGASPDMLRGPSITSPGATSW